MRLMLISLFFIIATEFKEFVVGQRVPDSFTVVSSDSNSVIEEGISEVNVTWRVKKSDGSWDMPDSFYWFNGFRIWRL